MEATVTTPTVTSPTLSQEERCQTVCRIANETFGKTKDWVVFFREIEPRKAVVEVENYVYATSQLAQTTHRSVLGQAELYDLLGYTNYEERDRAYFGDVKQVDGIGQTELKSQSTPRARRRREQ